jgi:hypothetical protein
MQVDPMPAPLPVPPAPRAVLRHRVGDWSLVQSENALYRRNDLMGGDFRLIYGPTAEEERESLHFRGPIVAHQGELWSFGPDGQYGRLALEPSGRPSSKQVGTLSSLASCGPVLAAVLDTRADQFVLVGYHADPGCGLGSMGQAWLARVRQDATVEPIPFSREDADRLGIKGRRIVDLAERGPGNLVLAATGRKLLSLEGMSLDEIPIDWDDPSTSEVEVAPPDVTCARNLEDFRRMWLESEDTWRAVSGAHGIAWAVGCAGAIARIGPTRAEGYGIGHARKEPGSIAVDQPLTAVRAYCPDQVLIGANGQQSYYELGQMFELAPVSAGDAPPDPPMGLPFMRVWHDFNVPGIGADVGQPSAILGGPRGVQLTFWGGRQRALAATTGGSVVTSGRNPRSVYPAGLNYGAVDAQGVALISSELALLLALPLR